MVALSDEARNDIREGWLPLLLPPALPFFFFLLMVVGGLSPGSMEIMAIEGAGARVAFPPPGFVAGSTATASKSRAITPYTNDMVHRWIRP
jgi:hypothetical protein